ncbi:hypothetical protein KR51_00006020 [Rubidibacter lacunae KORDI 51-2]|uniref:Uncharacterized protein n=1 Tax=Rubidibacter lacunae KORDI 51-2 TaxID=582515 RepID=U5DQ69_9CHRO|nr:hypothetical protein [Rubidibacter lacunae]ERN42754.1 hypothetical protein KR51_00006020 [Rubidibacter lacunae KORDI 51-2]
MSNIAGKSYAMNVVTPIPWYIAPINRLIFLFAKLRQGTLLGLLTLSLIHYARWVILADNQFPNLGKEQPKEKLKYRYMFFFSNFNGSWDQYVDSFSMAIPTGLDFFWFKNVRYPKSVPIKPFHDHIEYNQIWTNHYYNAYPMAASNDIKSAKNVKAKLLGFIEDTENSSAEEFQARFNVLLGDLQHDLVLMERTPIVSLAADAVEQRH